MFHVKQQAKKPCYSWIRAKQDKQIPPHGRANIAECAPESPAEPAGFILRMFQLHAEDRARLSPLPGSSGLDLYKPAKIAPFPG